MQRSTVRDKAKAAGLKRYFTGEPCPKGHIAERFVSSYGCVTCAEEKRDPVYQSDYRAAHKNKAKAYMVVWYAENAEQERKRSRQYRKENAEVVKEREKLRNAQPKRNAERREAIHRRRAVKGSYGWTDIRRLLRKQRGMCVGCGCDIIDCHTVDHILALSRGGTNSPENLQLLCWPCNHSKGTKTMAEWREWLAP